MASETSSRVTRNAIALAIRMILVTMVGLYTSRVILEALGVDDFGIYGVIGGVVGLAGFLNTSMGGATSRFITYELGVNNDEKLRKIFATSLIIHFILAMIVVVLAETIGLWFVNTKMNFPSERMTAVNVLYQFTILTMIVNFTQVPYSATIMAHEKMSIYAYLEFINACLKLGAVYLVIIFKWDKLILYAVLVFCISTLVALLYRLYCTRNYPEARAKLKIDRETMRQMVKFSGFDLYGNMCGAVRYQGMPLILNIFFGVVANAASTISMAVATAIKGLTTSIIQAFRPQVIKRYATGEIATMESIMMKANQFTLLAFAAVGVPVFFEASNVLKIWLGQVPPYSVEFLRLILISAFVEICANMNNAGVHATGSITLLSVVNGTIYLLCPVVGYMMLRFGTFPATLIYYIDIITMCCITTMGAIILKLKIRTFHLWKYMLSIVRMMGAIVLGCGVIWVLKLYVLNNIKAVGAGIEFIEILITTVVSLLSLAISSLLFGLGKEERDVILHKVKSLKGTFVNKIKRISVK